MGKKERRLRREEKKRENVQRVMNPDREFTSLREILVPEQKNALLKLHHNYLENVVKNKEGVGGIVMSVRQEIVSYVLNHGFRTEPQMVDFYQKAPIPESITTVLKDLYDRHIQEKKPFEGPLYSLFSHLPPKVYDVIAQRMGLPRFPYEKRRSEPVPEDDDAW